MSSALRRITGLVGVEGALLGVSLILLQTTAISPVVWAALPVVGGLTVVAGGAVMWRFRRGRLVLGTVVLIAGLGAVSRVPADHMALRAVVGFLLPLNLLIISWMPERGLLSRAGWLRVGVFGLQVPLVWGVCCTRWAPSGWLDHPLALGGTWGWTDLPPIAVAAFGVGFAAMAVRLIVRPNATGRGFLWALVAAFLSMAAFEGAAPSDAYAILGVGCLVAAVIDASYYLAYRDGLTGLPSRRALNEALMEVNGTYTVAMIDVDHFKQFNDRHGHDVGDQVLRKVASALDRVGGSGRAFRYGGEEFLLLFDGRTVEETLPHLERARAAVEETAFTIRGPDRPERRPDTPRPSGPHRGVTVTVSIGAAAPRHRRSAPSEVLEEADRALYRAKRAGRNRVGTAEAASTTGDSARPRPPAHEARA